MLTPSDEQGELSDGHEFEVAGTRITQIHKRSQSLVNFVTNKIDLICHTQVTIHHEEKMELAFMVCIGWLVVPVVIRSQLGGQGTEYGDDNTH